MTLAVASNHFLGLPHHHAPEGPELDGIVPDTSTVAAHDFDVDVNTGFMPTHAPLTRIPLEVSTELQAWERALDEGLALRMKLGDQLHLHGPEETEKNERWRASIRAQLRRPHRHLREFVMSTHAAYTAHIINDRGMPWFASSTAGLAPRASLFQTAAVGESGVKAATELQAAYDSSVAALKRFRDGHIKIATRYIVNMARRQTTPAEVDSKGELTTDGIKGTGGTSLVPFLKECRDNTVRAMVHPPSPAPGLRH
ncbi:hypothetical protein FRC06_000220 [Ceratobasidium sp. 370]|nr:hypothetical protein FRC06_000220 [Ceratobasidium sp. 370]